MAVLIIINRLCVSSLLRQALITSITIIVTFHTSVHNDFERDLTDFFIAFSDIDLFYTKVGTVIGCLLALDHYLPKYRTKKEGVVVNVASTTGLEVFGALPIYVATKHAVVGLTQSWGSESHYNRTKVRFLTLCPGPTDTTLALDGLDKNLGPAYQDIFKESQPFVTLQNPQHVAKALTHAIQYGKNGSIWVAEDSEPPYEVVMPSKEQMRKPPT